MPDLLHLDLLIETVNEADVLMGMMPASASRPTSVLVESIWNEVTHPRWPPHTKDAEGKDIGGEFMRAGQTFMHDGQRWDIHSIADGHIIANEASGDVKKVETRVFTPQQMEFGDGMHPSLDGASLAPPVVLTSGKSEAQVNKYNAPIVEAGLDHLQPHDPSVELPAGSPLTLAEWEAFPLADQLYYREVMARYGPWKNPGGLSGSGPQKSKAKAVFAKANEEFGSTDATSLITSMFKSQKGSSTGNNLNLASMFSHLKSSSSSLKAVQKKYAQAREVESDMNGVIAYDLYNRLKAPDISVRHQGPNQEGFFGSIVKGEHAVMSGLSTSWTTSWNWGEQNTLGMSIPIRHMVMAVDVTGDVYGLAGEHEFATADRVKVNPNIAAFWSKAQVPESGSNPLWKWLKSKMDHKPAPGSVMKAFAAQLAGKADLPGIEQDLNFVPKHAAGGGVKTYVIPPDDFMHHVEDEIAKDPGKPTTSEKQTVADLDLKPGDVIQGNAPEFRYLVIEVKKPTVTYLALGKGAPGNYDSEGVKLYTTQFTSSRFKIDKHFDIPAVKQVQVEKYNPDEWVPQQEAVKIGSMAIGTKIRVPDDTDKIGDWEVTNSSSTSVTIKNLSDSSEATVNPLFKVQPLVRTSALVTPLPGSLMKMGSMVVQVRDGSEDGKTWTVLGPDGGAIQSVLASSLAPLPSYKPDAPMKGDTFASNGKKYTVTNVQVNGTVKAKATGGKVEAFSGDHPALEGLLRPSDLNLGEKQKLKDLQPGDLFSGSASVVRPYMTLGQFGSKVKVKNLDTGEVMEFSAGKSYPKLTPVTSAPAEDAPVTGKEWGTVDPVEGQFKLGQDLYGHTAADLEIGDKLSFSNGAALTVIPSTQPGMVTLKPSNAAPLLHLDPLSKLATMPGYATYAGHVQQPGYPASPSPSGGPLQPGDHVQGLAGLHVGAIVQIAGDTGVPTKFQVIGDNGSTWEFATFDEDGTKFGWQKTALANADVTYLGDASSVPHAPTGTGPGWVNSPASPMENNANALGLGVGDELISPNAEHLKIDTNVGSGSAKYHLTNMVTGEGKLAGNPNTVAYKKASAEPSADVQAMIDKFNAVKDTGTAQTKDAVADGGFVGFKLPKNHGMTHHLIGMDMGAGDYFADSKGKAWKKVSQNSDGTATITDGKDLYTVDDKARGKIWNYVNKPLPEIPTPPAVMTAVDAPPQVGALDIHQGDVLGTPSGDLVHITSETPMNYTKLAGPGPGTGTLPLDGTYYDHYGYIGIPPKMHSLPAQEPTPPAPDDSSDWGMGTNFTIIPATADLFRESSGYSNPNDLSPFSFIKSKGHVYYKSKSNPVSGSPSQWFMIGHSKPTVISGGAVKVLYPSLPDPSGYEKTDEKVTFANMTPGMVIGSGNSSKTYMVLGKTAQGMHAIDLGTHQVAFMKKKDVDAYPIVEMKPTAEPVPEPEPEIETETPFGELPAGFEPAEGPVGDLASSLKPGDEFIDDDGDHHTVVQVADGKVETKYSASGTTGPDVLGPSWWSSIGVTGVKHNAAPDPPPAPADEGWSKLSKPYPLSEVSLKVGDQFKDTDGDTHTVTGTDNGISSSWKTSGDPPDVVHGPFNWGATTVFQVTAVKKAKPDDAPSAPDTIKSLGLQVGDQFTFKNGKDYKITQIDGKTPLNDTNINIKTTDLSTGTPSYFSQNSEVTNVKKGHEDDDAPEAKVPGKKYKSGTFQVGDHIAASNAQYKITGENDTQLFAQNIGNPSAAPSEVNKSSVAMWTYVGHDDQKIITVGDSLDGYSFADLQPGDMITNGDLHAFLKDIYGDLYLTSTTSPDSVGVNVTGTSLTPGWTYAGKYDPANPPASTSPPDLQVAKAAILPPAATIATPPALADPNTPVDGIPDYSGTVLTGAAGAGGTTGAQIKSDLTGKKWLVKTYGGNQDRIATELLANAIYRDMGLKAANAGKLDGQLAYPLVDGSTAKFSKVGSSQKKVELGKGFMTDVLLANRDFAGLEDDNVLWNGDEPTRIDQGASFFYRAQGQKKDFDANPAEDLKNFLTIGQGKNGVTVTEQDLRSQAKKIGKMFTPAEIDERVDQAGFADPKMRDDVKENLKQRVAWMQSFGDGDEPLPAGINILKATPAAPASPVDDDAVEEPSTDLDSVDDGLAQVGVAAEADMPVAPYLWHKSGGTSYPALSTLKPDQTFQDKQGNQFTVLNVIGDHTYVVSNENKTLVVPNSFVVAAGAKAGKTLPTRVKVLS